MRRVKTAVNYVSKFEDRIAGLAGHLGEELHVAVGLLEALDEHVHGALGVVDAVQNAPNTPDERCLLGIQEQLLFAGA